MPLNGNLIDLFFSLQYDCDFWGKNRQLFQAAVGEKLAIQAEVAQIQLLLTTAIARAYIAVKIDLFRQDLIKQLVLQNKPLDFLGAYLRGKFLLMM